MGRLDAVVVGSGPNGLAAAIELARAGRSVRVLEAAETVGGGMRSAELTLPGYVHDVCSAVHALAVGSPFLRSLPLPELVHPSAPLAHPLDDGSAVMLERSVELTAGGLDAGDDEAWLRLVGPLVDRADALLDDVLGPLRLPRHPLLLARFGLGGVRSAEGLARGVFRGERAPALFAGLAAHSMLPLTAPVSASFGLVLAVLGHAYGWPVVRGGSGRLADALAELLRSLGGEIETDRRVGSLGDLPPARAVLLDVTPQQVLELAGERLPARYARGLRRFRYGPGAFKLDYALAGPIPWRAPECARAATVHLGGTFAEIAASEAAPGHERPFVLLVQASRFDETRAPEGKHTAWAYCHVPNGWRGDATDAIEGQIERFAPGFRDLVLARVAHGPAELERYDENYVGGDINGGLQDFRQLFGRPVPRLAPYSTPVPGLYLCSSSTPPGGGVHGMCGFHAARAALAGTLR
jgi:phytoene dehydrogenase-like protein